VGVALPLDLGGETPLYTLAYICNNQSWTVQSTGEVTIAAKVETHPMYIRNHRSIYRKRRKK